MQKTYKNEHISVLLKNSCTGRMKGECYAVTFSKGKDMYELILKDGNRVLGRLTLHWSGNPWCEVFMRKAKETNYVLNLEKFGFVRTSRYIRRKKFESKEEMFEFMDVIFDYAFKQQRYKDS